MLKNILKDKYLRVVAGISVFTWILTAIIFYSWFDLSGGNLILHFDAYKGIDFLGGEADVFGILLSGLVIILINLFLSDFMYTRERFLAYIFTFSNLAFSILILIVINVIISIN